MPRQKRKMEGEGPKPLLRFERVVYEKASFRLRQELLQQITEYACYVKEVTGAEPMPDELVDRGMQRLFDADRGFRQWRQQTRTQGGIERESAREQGIEDVRETVPPLGAVLDEP